MKNGQQKHFPISEDEAKVFVTAGKVGPKARCEFVRIPEGREDVFLTGSKRGKAFRFENAVTEEIREPIREYARKPVREYTLEPIREHIPEPIQEHTREHVRESPKKNSRTGTNLLLAVSILCFLGAAVIGGILAVRMFRSEPERVGSRQFRVENLQITLTEEFQQREAADSTACYFAPGTAVALLQEEFSLEKGFGDLTVEEYGERVLEKNGLTSRLRSENGMTVFDYVYTDPDSEESFYCYTVLIKGPGAFWTVRFCATAEATQDRLPSFQQWASSIQVEA